MAGQLRERGFEGAVALEGGIEAWKEAGYPMADGRPPEQPRPGA